MTLRSVFCSLLLLLASGVAQCQQHALTFVKQIGAGWNDEKENGWMSVVSFSPDGAMVASDRIITPRTPAAKSIHTLTLWSFPEGHCVRQLPLDVGDISSDWKYLIASEYRTDGALKSASVVEMETGKPVVSSRKDRYLPVAFSPDSQYVVETFSGKRVQNARIRVLELATGKSLSTFGEHTPVAVAMSPDGVTLAAGYWDVIILWNAATGERLATLPGLGRYVISLSFSKNGELLAAGSDTGKLEIWDVRRRIKTRSVDLDGAFGLKLGLELKRRHRAASRSRG